MSGQSHTDRSPTSTAKFWRQRHTWKLIRRCGQLCLLAMCVVGAILLGWVKGGQTLESHYAITGRAPFNQPGFYPIQQTLPADRYRAIAPWVGRLILPSTQEQGDTDWVWMEVTVAPPAASDLIGQRVRLEWSQDPTVQLDVGISTRDVNFDPKVQDLRRKKADLFPDRLNGRSHVGPLQSIAGARPKDDVIVSLMDVALIRPPAGNAVLQIKSQPLQTTGRFYALAKILGTVAKAPPQFVPKACPGQRPCSSELFRVQHYNPITKQFDGVIETIRIPQQPIDGIGVYASTPRDLETSPAGKAGWYLYGAQDKTGLFTVQAIKPRSLMQLQPQQFLSTEADGLNFINIESWKNTATQKGTVQTVLIHPSIQPSEAAIASWQVGDRALVMHLFGGRGGNRGEASFLGTVTGHFSYGFAEVIRDPFTNELQFDVTYSQVYANNVEGVIAGENSWVNYMGNLQRGWLGTRPVADVLIKLDTIAEDYDFGGIQVSPLSELRRQLQIINDRYRTGDGTGIASVTAATSCVQDSNQALFVTIQTLRSQVESSPEIQAWWASHPDNPMIKRFERLIALGTDLEKQLTPFGIVRQDWKTNANFLSGTQVEQPDFVRAAADIHENLVLALKSWRTILPRQAQDELSTLFLRHGAQLWFLKTYQVGGHDRDIVPIAPTSLFGQWTLPGTNLAIVNILFTRILSAISLPTDSQLGIGLGLLLGYGAIAIPIGVSQHFLHWQPWSTSVRQQLQLAARLLLMPALVEELVFRVMLLPIPRGGITDRAWIVWAVVNLIIFIAYHPFNAMTFYKRGNPTFFNPVFLTLTGVLGLVCTLAFWLTHSLLLITLIHWIVAVVWIILLGGMKLLDGTKQLQTHDR